jgi:peptidoglycan/xylan/chitin deacetylase (PgdA/CDA1 family)
MQESGLDVGGHTHNHKVLSKMAVQDRISDLDRSTQLLSARLGEGVRGFAYPYGKPETYSPEIIEQLERLGYLCAFNTIVGRGEPGVSRWEIPRVDPKDL